MARRARNGAGGSALLLVMMAGVSTAWANPIDAVWNGGSGSWNTAANWSGIVVPNNAGGNVFRAIIDSTNPVASVVTLNTNVTIGGLVIDAGDEVIIDNARILTIAGGPIENAGTLRIGSAGGNTYLLLSTGPVELTGGGDVQLSNTNANWIYRGDFAGSLVNVDNTIRGSGNFGWSGAPMPIENQALVVADQSTALTVASGTAIFRNLGTLRAENGATLQLTGNIDNEDGLIEALDGSRVLLTNVTVNAGTLDSAGSGAVEAGFGGTLDGSAHPIHIQGEVRIPNGQILSARGELHNTGVITLNSAGGNTYLLPTGGPLTLTGGGEVRFSNLPSNWIYRGDADGSLVNVDNTIRGSGNLGWSGGPMPIENQALVVADQSAALTVASGTATFRNLGTLRAENGATLQLSGNIDNEDGLIEALDDSRVLLTSVTVSAGTLDSAGSGAVEAGSGSTLDGTAHPIHILGEVRIPNSQILRARGELHNTGVITLNSSGGSTYLWPTGGPLTLTGGGEVRLSNSATNWIYRGDDNGSLVNVDNTIRGAGNLGWSGAPTPLLNHGAVIADQSTALRINAHPTEGFVSTGHLEASGSGGIIVDGSGPCTTSGTVHVAAGSSLARTGVFTQTAGQTTVLGSFTATQGISLEGGILRGTGTVGTLSNSGGTVTPGLSLGTLAITGNYTQSGSGLFEVEVQGLDTGEADRLAATGTLSLGGTLKVIAQGEYTPAIGDMFTIATSSGISGHFTDYIAEGFPSGVTITMYRDGTTLRVAVVRPGDINCDGVVNFADISPFIAAIKAGSLEAWTEPCPWLNADANRDGTVNFADISPFIALIKAGAGG
ncbi:MAG: hypothetical protein IPM18_17635 [Phycisphaerales bacterium]|nr:hypothetical protein [Phycisphaerales bacterium]